ncbi:MAG: response regulator transcription factor, partial [Propionibacteriaceae bacterium]
MRVLVVEDEPRIAADVSAGLERAGYVVDVVADGEAAWFRAETETYDAMVLDLGLPRLDGLGVLRRLRAAGTMVPVLILTARDGWRERVEGIDAGADDYLAKPFRMEELAARLRAILRRTAGHASPVLRAGAVELDTRTRAVSVAGREIDLT